MAAFATLSRWREGLWSDGPREKTDRGRGVPSKSAMSCFVCVFVFAGAAADMEGADGLFRVIVRGGFQLDDDGRERNRLPAMLAEYAAVCFHFHLLNHGEKSPLKNLALGLFEGA